MYFQRRKSYEAYTDLACERRRADTSDPGVKYSKERATCGIWERIEIKTERAARSIERPCGFYDTLLLPRMDLLDKASIDDAEREIADELLLMCSKMKIATRRVLVVGLGNAALTPDSLGCSAASLVKPTLHIKRIDQKAFTELECAEIAVIKPGVCSESGLDPSEMISGLCKRLNPDFVIAIDSLAARAPERLGCTVQISSSGIIPGGGLGSPRAALDDKSLGTPVIAIGVPTVIDADLFIKKDVMRTGERSAMFVSPKEINEIVDVAAKTIAGGINRAFGLLV